MVNYKYKIINKLTEATNGLADTAFGVYSGAVFE